MVRTLSTRRSCFVSGHLSATANWTCYVEMQLVVTCGKLDRRWTPWLSEKNITGTKVSSPNAFFMAHSRCSPLSDAYWLSSVYLNLAAFVDWPSVAAITAQLSEEAAEPSPPPYSFMDGICAWVAATEA